MRRPPLLAALLLATITAALAPLRALAESALSLPRPPHFGDIAAETLDEAGHRIGSAHVRIDALASGGVSLLSESQMDDGAGNRLTAELAPVDGGAHLRPLVEESHTDLAGGQKLGFLRVDHTAGVLRCTPADGEAVEAALPAGERVALAPLNLLFLPLVRGEAQEIEFQIALCLGGPRIVAAKARLARPGGLQDDAASRLVEVRYELDFGPVLSSLARPFLPRFSLWFDPATAGDWMAHRMPLYSKGPTVVVLRTGVSPDLLNLAR